MSWIFVVLVVAGLVWWFWPSETVIVEIVEEPDRGAHNPSMAIKLDQDWPEGIDTYVESEVPVAGISQYGQRDRAAKCILGREQRVELIRDPDNPHDPNAIKVIAHWMDRKGVPWTGQIGWVPREVAAQIEEEHPDTPIGARIRVMFAPERGKSPGMRIDIGRPRKRPTN